MCQLPSLPLPSPAAGAALLDPQQALNPVQPLNASNPEDMKKVMGAVVGAMAMAGVVAAVKESETKSGPSVVEYVTGTKVSGPATYVSHPAMTCTGKAYCFPQILDKVSAAPQCPAGYAYDAQAIKCYKYAGYECPKGASSIKGNPASCTFPCSIKVGLLMNLGVVVSFCLFNVYSFSLKSCLVYLEPWSSHECMTMQSLTSNLPIKSHAVFCLSPLPCSYARSPLWLMPRRRWCSLTPCAAMASGPLPLASAA